MTLLFLAAYLRLILFDLRLAKGDFHALCEKVHDYPLGNKTVAPGTAERVCLAVDMACIWYWKTVLCLHRASVTACLLKSRGVPSHLVIGARQMPFKAHAWVEVNGVVVGDKPYVSDTYSVLERF